MFDYPWLLLLAVVACSPLIWITVAQFFPNIRADLEEDGLPLAVGAVTGYWIATWTVLKLLVFLVVCAAYITGAYKLAVWLLG